MCVCKSDSVSTFSFPRGRKDTFEASFAKGHPTPLKCFIFCLIACTKIHIYLLAYKIIKKPFSQSEKLVYPDKHVMVCFVYYLDYTSV